MSRIETLLHLHQQVQALEKQWAQEGKSLDLEGVLHFRHKLVSLIEKMNGMQSYVSETRQSLFFIAYGLHSRLFVLNAANPENLVRFPVSTHQQALAFTACKTRRGEAYVSLRKVASLPYADSPPPAP